MVPPPLPRTYGEPVLGEQPHDPRGLGDEAVDVPVTYVERPEPYVAEHSVRRVHRSELQFVRKGADIRLTRVRDGLSRFEYGSRLVTTLFP